MLFPVLDIKKVYGIILFGLFIDEAFPVFGKQQETCSEGKVDLSS